MLCTGEHAMKKREMFPIIQEGMMAKGKNYNCDECYEEEKVNPKEGAHPKKDVFFFPLRSVKRKIKLTEK